MNQIPVYREQIQSALKEIRANKGKVQRIVSNVIHYTDGAGEASVFVPEVLESGIMFFKKPAKDFVQA